jgi:hypothetical protein
VAGCCECGDEPSGSCATELVSLFVRERGNCKTNDKVHSYNTKSALNYRQSAHNCEIYNCRPTIAGGKFYNRLRVRIKLIKDNLLFRRQLKQLLIKGCYYSVEEYMCDDFDFKY